MGKLSPEIPGNSLRYGAGLGLRYNTPAGAIGLDAGFNPDREEGEDRLVLHIVFGLFF